MHLHREVVFYTEAVYVLGLFCIAAGAAFLNTVNLGMSMLDLPAYILHAKLVLIFPYATLGVSEYCVQFLLLVSLSIIMKKIRLSYILALSLFSPRNTFGRLYGGHQFADLL